MTSPSTRVRVGICGAPDIVKTYHLPVLLEHPRISVSWILEPDERRAAPLRAMYGVAVEDEGRRCTPTDIVLVTNRPSPMHQLGTVTLRDILAGPAPDAASAQLPWFAVHRSHWAGARARSLIVSGAVGRLLEVAASAGAAFGRAGGIGSTGVNVVDALGLPLLDLTAHAGGLQSVTMLRHDDQSEDGVVLESRAELEAVGAWTERVAVTLRVSWLRDLHRGIALRTDRAEVRISPDADADLRLLDLAGKEVVTLAPPVSGEAAVYAAYRAAWDAVLGEGHEVATERCALDALEAWRGSAP